MFCLFSTYNTYMSQLFHMFVSMCVFRTYWNKMSSTALSLLSVWKLSSSPTTHRGTYAGTHSLLHRISFSDATVWKLESLFGLQFSSTQFILFFSKLKVGSIFKKMSDCLVFSTSVWFFDCKPNRPHH